MIKKKRLIILLAFLGTLMLLLFTYIPHKIITIDPVEISKIEIFDGTTGKGLTIDNKNEIQHIISNLNGVTFSKDKISLGYMGYRFRITIYKNNGRKYKQFIVNSNDTIRYNGFFYRDKTKSIDYEYLNELFKQRS